MYISIHMHIYIYTCMFIFNYLYILIHTCLHISIDRFRKLGWLNDSRAILYQKCSLAYLKYEFRLLCYQFGGFRQKVINQRHGLLNWYGKVDLKISLYIYVGISDMCIYIYISIYIHMFVYIYISICIYIYIFMIYFFTYILNAGSCPGNSPSARFSNPPIHRKVYTRTHSHTYTRIQTHVH